MKSIWVSKWIEKWSVENVVTSLLLSSLCVAVVAGNHHHFAFSVCVCLCAERTFVVYFVFSPSN